MEESKSQLEQAMQKLVEYKRMAKKEIDFFSKALELDEGHLDMLILSLVGFQESIVVVKREIELIKNNENCRR